jgi:hypothetical protein
MDPLIAFWSDTRDDPATCHFGPMAQDFKQRRAEPDFFGRLFTWGFPPVRDVYQQARLEREMHPGGELA